MSGGRRRVGSTADRLARLPYHRRVCRAEFHYPEPPPVNGEAVTGPSVQEWVERAHDMGVEMTVVSAEVDRGTPRFRSRLLPPHPRVDEDRLPAFLRDPLSGSRPADSSAAPRRRRRRSPPGRNPG